MLAFAKSIAVCAMVLVIFENRSLAETSLWLGQNVILKSPTSLQIERRRVDDGKRVCFYQVLQIEGEQLLLSNECAQGWVKESSVVLASKANEYFNKAIQAQPTNADLFLRRAVVSISFGDKDQALDDLNESLRLNANQFQAIMLRAQLHWEGHHIAMSLHDLEKGLDITREGVSTLFAQSIPLDSLIEIATCFSSEDAESISQRICLCTNNKQYDRALRYLDRAMQIDPRCISAHLYHGYALHEAQRFQEAIEALSLCIHLDPSKADAFLLRGNSYKRLEQWNNALADATTAVRMEPLDFQMHLILGDVLRKMDNPEKAISAFSECLKLNPSNADALRLRADCYKNTGKDEEAISDYTALLLLMEDADARRSRGRLWYKKEDYTKAVADFDPYLQKYPDDDKTLRIRGFANFSLSNYLLAISDFDRAIHLNPEAQDYYWRGQSWAKIGEYQKAIADFDEAIRLAPTDADYFVQRGLANLLAENTQKAFEDAMTAIQIDDCNPDAYVLRGMCRRRNCQYQNAIADYSTAIKLSPENVIPYRLRADALLHEKEYAQAISDYNRILRIIPADPEAMIGRLQAQLKF
ncbi:MAG: tetratricopeptide repeat protein [Planctomycetaceae bacterium]